MGAASGDSKQGLRYQTIEAGLGWQPRPGTVLQATLPWVHSQGDLGSASGVGDLFLAVDQQLAQTRWGDWSLALGLRLPTGADDALVGAGLGYQPGLGTTDTVIGVGWMAQGFDARVGYIASFGINGTSGVELDRGNDLALGAGYTAYHGPWSGRFGLLVLDRLADSSITDGHGGRITVDQSAGLQSNAQLTIAWQPHQALRLHLDGAKALQSRETNAGIDGLTRSWSLSLGAHLLW